MERALILYDADCGLCRACVKFLLEHEAGDQFLFSSMYSDCGRGVRQKHGLGQVGMQTIILIEGERAHVRWAAVVRMARRLKWPWSMVQWTMVLPAEMLDWGYDYVAARRYRWFGGEDACPLPVGQWRGKFVDE